MTKTFDTPETLSADLHSFTLAEPSPDDNIETLSFTDIDQAVFDHINEKVNLHAEFQNVLRKVKVIFAAGERWAMVRDNLRDENGTLILPAISIRRTTMNRGHDVSLPAGGVSLPSLVYRVKRAQKNVHYQNLKNDLGLRNQSNVGINISTNDQDAAGKTSRRISAKSFSGKIFRGKRIANKTQPEILDIFSIGYPDFFVFEYEITFWTQYIEVMNSLVQRFANSFETFSIDSFKIETKKGYWLVGYIDPALDNQENFEDFSDTERIVKQSLKLSVPAYSIQAQPGDTNLVRKFTSMPEISFSVVSVDTMPDLTELRLKNPLDIGRLTDIEDKTDVVTGRPRLQRKRSREITKKMSKKKISENSVVFPNVDELIRFFK